MGLNPKLDGEDVTLAPKVGVLKEDIEVLGQVFEAFLAVLRKGIFADVFEEGQHAGLVLGPAVHFLEVVGGKGNVGFEGVEVFGIETGGEAIDVKGNVLGLGHGAVAGELG